MDELIKIPKGKLKEIIRITRNISEDASKDGTDKMGYHIIKQNAERIMRMCNEILEIYGGEQNDRDQFTFNDIYMSLLFWNRCVDRNDYSHCNHAQRGA